MKLLKGNKYHINVDRGAFDVYYHGFYTKRHLFEIINSVSDFGWRASAGNLEKFGIKSLYSNKFWYFEMSELLSVELIGKIQIPIDDIFNGNVYDYAKSVRIEIGHLSLSEKKELLTKLRVAGYKWLSEHYPDDELVTKDYINDACFICIVQDKKLAWTSVTEYTVKYNSGKQESLIVNNEPLTNLEIPIRNKKRKDKKTTLLIYIKTTDLL